MIGNLLLPIAFSVNIWLSEPVKTIMVKEAVGTYTISAYSYSEGYGENYQTAGGYVPKPYYTVATTLEYPIGTKLFIDEIGIVQVQDRGNFPLNRIDLHVGHDNPESFGLQNRRVYRLKKKVITYKERIGKWLKETRKK